MTEPCAQLQRRGHWAEDALDGRCDFPIGPRNTWSNLAYPLCGVALVRLDPSPAAWTMASALLCLGVGSGLYHGFKTLWANRLDWTGMYLVFGCLSVHGLAPSHPAVPWLMALTGILLAVLFAYVVPNVSLEVQMGVLVWFSALQGILAGHWQLVVLGMGTFVLAFGIWQLDQRRVTGKWGHATWHVLTAIAIPLLFLAQG